MGRFLYSTLYLEWQAFQKKGNQNDSERMRL